MMKQYLFLGMILLGVVFSVNAGKKGKYERLTKYRESISSLNLLNGLHLSKKQTSKLLDLNKDVKLLSDKFLKSSDYKDLKKNAEDSMKRLYEFLKYNPNEEDSTIQHQAGRDDHKFKEYIKRMKKKMDEKMDAILEEAEEVLTPEQLEVVCTFKACVVPPKDLRDPVRAGQAKQSSGIMKELLKLRRLRNKKEVKRRCEHIADRLVDTTHKYYNKMNSDEMKKMHRSVVKKLKSAYEMKETEFELKKDDIVAYLEPDKEKKKLYNSADYKQKSKTYKLKRFLLNPDVMVPILTAWLKTKQRGGLR